MTGKDLIYFLLCFFLGVIAENVMKRLAIRVCSRQTDHSSSSFPSFRLLFPLLTGALFVLAFHMNRQEWPALLLSWSFISFCLLVTLTDLYVQRIPNVILVSFLPLFLSLILITQPDLLVSHFLGGLTGILVLLAPALITPEKAGMGDVKLLGVVGFALGLHKLLPCVLLASLFAFAAALFVLVMKKGNLLFCLPFAPFLSAGAILIDLYGTSEQTVF